MATLLNHIIPAKDEEASNKVVETASAPSIPPSVTPSSAPSNVFETSLEFDNENENESALEPVRPLLVSWKYNRQQKGSFESLLEEEKQLREQFKLEVERTIYLKEKTKALLENVSDVKFFRVNTEQELTEKLKKLRLTFKDNIDVHFVDDNGKTLLDRAIEGKNRFMIFEVIKLGVRKTQADITKKDLHGNTLLDYALELKDVRILGGLLAIYTEKRLPIPDVPRIIKSVEGWTSEIRLDPTTILRNQNLQRLALAQFLIDTKAKEKREKRFTHFLSIKNMILEAIKEIDTGNLETTVKEISNEFRANIPILTRSLGPMKAIDLVNGKNPFLNDQKEVLLKYSINIALIHQVVTEVFESSELKERLEDDQTEVEVVGMQLALLVDRLIIMTQLADECDEFSQKIAGKHSDPFQKEITNFIRRFKNVQDAILLKIKKMLPEEMHELYFDIRTFCRGSAFGTIDYSNANIRKYKVFIEKDFEDKIDSIKRDALKQLVGRSEEDIEEVISRIDHLHKMEKERLTEIEKTEALESRQFPKFLLFFELKNAMVRSVEVIKAYVKIFIEITLEYTEPTPKSDRKLDKDMSVLSHFEMTKNLERKVNKEKTQASRQQNMAIMEATQSYLKLKEIMEQKEKMEKVEKDKWRDKLLARLANKKSLNTDLINILNNPDQKVLKRDFCALVFELQIPGYEKINNDKKGAQDNKLNLSLGRFYKFTCHFRHHGDNAEYMDPASIHHLKNMLEFVGLTANLLSQSQSSKVVVSH